VAGQNSGDFMQQTVSGFAARVSEYADGIAGRLGQPMSGTQLTKDDAVQRWNYSPLGSTQAADAAYHQLVASGTPPGKALDQVYPMRSMLYRGADVQEAVSNARQIAGWAADATGQPAPDPPKESTLPAWLAMQHNAQAQQPAPLPTQGPPPMMPPAIAPQPMPAAPGPMPGPVAAGPAPVMPPPPGMLAGPLPGIPGVSS
jgi:hypothetical protein